MLDVLFHILMYALLSSLIKLAHGSRYLPDEGRANMCVSFLTFVELLVSAIGVVLFLAILLVNKLSQ